MDMKQQDLKIVIGPHPPQPKSIEGLTLNIKLKESEIMVSSQARYPKNFHIERVFQYSLVRVSKSYQSHGK